MYDAGHIIVGSKLGDIIILKFGNDGPCLNGTTLRGAKHNKVDNVVATDDGVFLWVGSSNSPNGIVSGN